MTAVGNPSTDPVTLVNGPNEIPLDKASTGITGAKLKFDASVLSGMLSLANIKVVAPAGTDTHVLKPRFIRITPDKQYADPADSFSKNVDVTVAGGTEGNLSPAPRSSRVRAGGPSTSRRTRSASRQRKKIEKGTVQVTVAPQTCKNVATFQANVLPALRGTGVTLNCNNCHNNGLAGLSLGSNDAALVCAQVMSKLNQANIGQSVIVTKVTVGPHNGGLVGDTKNGSGIFMNNAAAFF